MRQLFGRAPVVLARRYLRLERLAMVTLHRDQFADTPGPSVSLALGERTTYRPGAWLLDRFERAGPALGSGYTTPSGFGGLVIADGGVVPADVGAIAGAVHAKTLPADQWAAAELGAIDGAGSAAVGVVVRWDDVGDGYVVTAVRDGGVGRTDVARYDGGAPAVLATTPTPWRAGEVVRVSCEGPRVRVYRGGILVVDVVDAGDAMASGRAGIVAAVGTGDDVARVAAWTAGAWRQEYLGAVLDMGDVKHALGQPVSFDLAVSNLAPMGGKPRFAALLRHGLNTDGTFDLDRGTVRVYSAIRDAEAPVMVGAGLIDAPGDLTEDRARLQIRGRDAFLTPRIDPGPVQYLAGPLPVAAPIPDDPCATSPPPTVDPGAPPVEPDPDDPHEGEGPEAPDEPTPPPAPEPPLTGQYVTTFGYAGFGTDGQELLYGTDVKEYRNADAEGGWPPGRGSVPVWDRRQRDRDPDNPDKDGQPPKDINDPEFSWSPGQPIPAGMGVWVNHFANAEGGEYTRSAPCVCGNCDAPVIPDPPPGHSYLGSCYAGGCGAGPTPGSRCDPDSSFARARRPVRAPSRAAPRATDEARPYARHYRWLYRGPDVGGSHLSRDPADESTQALLFEEWWSIAPLDYDNSATTYGTREIKLARYDASGIHSTADLSAINAKNMPARIETLATWSINGGVYTFKTTSVYFAKALTLNALPLNLLTGPQLIGIELPSVGWSNGAIPRSEIAVWPHVNAATRLLKIIGL